MYIHMWVCTSVQVCGGQERASDRCLPPIMLSYSFKTGSFSESWGSGTCILLARLKVCKFAILVSASFRIGVPGLHRLSSLFRVR